MTIYKQLIIINCLFFYYIIMIDLTSNISSDKLDIIEENINYNMVEFWNSNSIEIINTRPISDYFLDLSFFCLKIIFFFITLWIVFFCSISFLDKYTISDDIKYYWSSISESLFW